MKKNTFWFKLGSYAMVVTAGLHMIGHFSSAEPTNETEKTLLELMTTHRIDFGGIERSMMDFHDLDGRGLRGGSSRHQRRLLHLSSDRHDRVHLALLRSVAIGGCQEGPEPQ